MGEFRCRRESMRRGFGAAGLGPAYLAGFGVASLVSFVSFAGPARADVVIAIDKAAQRMAVTVDGKQEYLWKVSTGTGSAEAAGEVLVLAQIRHVADAALDLL